MKPAVRISLGIVALSTSLLLLADTFFGIFPDPNMPVIEARLDLSESLAIQYTTFVTADRLPQMQPAMDALVMQRPDVLSVSLRTNDGQPLAATSEHDALWERSEGATSTPTQIQVPVYKGADSWGTLEVKFDTLPYSGIVGLLNTPLYRLVGIMAAGGFFAYLIYMSRTLRYLDPSSVVPERVRTALDQLVEGVFILDERERIVLVNNAFARNLGRTPDELMGVRPSTMDWIDDEGATIDGKNLPWCLAVQDGARRADIRLKLNSAKRGTRIFSCNVSPISDKNGKRRGVLASLDDISEIEMANEELRRAMVDLEAAHAEVRSKNEELFRLATVDALTGILNRRAFLEKLEMELHVAKRDKLVVSIVMADIDFFKSVNDTYGHATGDTVIQDMANVLSDVLEPNDRVGRLGGEEFCMVLVGADAQTAMETSNRARMAFEQLSQLSDSATGGNKITASFGVTSSAYGAADVAELLEQSDMALYGSKNAGRNRVTNWPDLDDEQRAVS